MFTLAHEVTHYIKEWSPQKFEVLADFVTKQMDVDAEPAIADKLSSLKRLGIVKDTMTVAEANALAREELVAEGMELVLTDGKVLEELAHTDRSLWQKVKAWIQNIISKIRKYYGELNQASKTAQVLKETVESLEEIERLFTEGVREAGERTRKAGVETKSENTIRFSLMNDLSLQENVDQVMTMDDETAKSKKAEDQYISIMSTTPDIITENVKDAEKLEIVMRFDSFYLATRHDGALEGHYHNYGEIMKKLPEIISDPEAIVRMDNGRLNLLAMVKTQKGNNTVVSIELNTVKDINSKYKKYNLVVSVVPSKDNYMRNNLFNHGVRVEYQKEDLPQVNHQLYEWLAIVNDKSSGDSITQPKDSVNSKFSISEENSSDTAETPDVYGIEDETPLEAAARRMREREAEERGDVWTLEDEDRRRQAIRDHELLADALMETAQSESEYRTVKRYKEKVEEIADAESRITELRKKTAELNREMDSLREKIKGVEKSKREVWVMTALDDATTQKNAYLKEMDELSEMIRKEEAKLLSLAAAKPLQKAIREANKRADAMARVAEREKQRAEEDRKRSREREAKTRQKAKERADERVQKEKEKMERLAGESKERGEITIRKRTVMRVLGSLETKLYHPTKTNHVPKELHDLAMKTLAAADPGAFGKNRANIKEMGELAAKIERLEKKADRTAKEQDTMNGWKARYEELEGETIPLQKQAEAMLTAFIEYNDKAPEDLKLPKGLLNIMINRVAEIENVPLSKMGLRSLEAVEAFVKMLSQQVTSANELFAQKRGEQVSEWGNVSSREASESKPLKLLSPTEMEWKGAQLSLRVV